MPAKPAAPSGTLSPASVRLESGIEAANRAPMFSSALDSARRATAASARFTALLISAARGFSTVTANVSTAASEAARLASASCAV